MRKFFLRALLLLSGQVMLLLASIIAWTSFSQIHWPQVSQPLAIGFSLGFIFCFFISPLQRFYIFNHEFAHWITAKAFRKKIGRFHVAKDHGFVEIHGLNLWIDLAPYLFPSSCFLFSIPWIGMQFWPGRPSWINMAYTGLLAFLFAHHLFFTFKLLIYSKQTDITKNGYFSASSFVLGCNAIIILGFTLSACFSIQEIPTLLKDSFELIKKLSLGD